jgi:putative pyruvate formate lyase activating enzyme
MGGETKPAYLDLTRHQLRERVDAAGALLSRCTVCPRDCGVDRTAEEKGICRTGNMAIVSSFNPHFGEETPLVGRGGSGTIFFSCCNLKCLFCQNWEISHLGEGDEVDARKLSSIMMYLQRLGCENVNFVSPTHVVPQILAALPGALDRGFRLPLVYNTGGYDSPETLRLLEGVIDIYMPDMKYSSPAVSKKLSGVEDYPRRNQDAVLEMHRQVGDLKVDGDGIATRGLLVRHLVLPENLAGTLEVTRFLAQEVSKNTYINVMDQYRPCHGAGDLPPLSRRTSREEHEEAVQTARKTGLWRLDSPSGRRILL